MDVEVNSPDETEDEITWSDEFLALLKRFKCEDINSQEYFKEVKRMIFNNMDSYASLSKLSVLNFHSKYRKKFKRNYDRADSLFDVWMTITQKQRQMFRCSNKITRPCQERLMKLEENAEYICAELIEKRKKRYILN